MGRAPNFGIATLVLAAALGLAASACGGSIAGAVWIDERTVILPRGSITYEWDLALRAQVAHERSCPEDQIAVAEAVEIGQLTVIPVLACGDRAYYVSEGGGFVDASARITSGDASVVVSAPALAPPPAPANAPPTDDPAPVID